MKTRDQIGNDALNAIGTSRVSGVEMSMGSGKTRLALSHMAKFYTDINRYLVVAPKKSIFDSWKDEISKHNYDYLDDQITYSTYRSLDKQNFDYDCVYLDECHSLKKTHNQWLLTYLRLGGKIVGLTGTYPTVAYSEKGKMCNFYCPKVYTYITDEAISDEILNEYEVYVHELELSNKLNIPVKGPHGDFMVSEISTYQYWSSRIGNKDDEDDVSGKEGMMLRIQRMKALQNFTSKEKYAKLLFNSQTLKTIIFANTQKQADALCDHSYHTKNPDSKKNLEAFKKGEIIKLSAVEQLSEGVNIPNLHIGIIMHAYANNVKANQKLGRMLRLNPNDKATIHILCYANSVDKEWVTQALKNLDQTKIHWIKPLYYAGIHY